SPRLSAGSSSSIGVSCGDANRLNSTSRRPARCSVANRTVWPTLCRAPDAQQGKERRGLVLCKSLGCQLIAALLICAGCKERVAVKKSFPFLETYASAPPTNLTQLQQDDGQWIMPAKNYQSTRFSGLNEINAQNVRNLKV